jgi:hypothetical protein
MGCGRSHTALEKQAQEYANYLNGLNKATQVLSL